MINYTEKNKKNNKLIIAIILTILFVISGFIFFILQSNNILHKIAISKQSKMQFKWPDTQISSLIPAPQSTNGHIGYSSDKRLSVDVYNVTLDDYLDYCEQCKTYSFHYHSNQDDRSFIAYDPNGNRLTISYDVNSAQMTIYIRTNYEDEGDFIPVNIIGLKMEVKSATPSGCIVEITQEGGNITGELITGSSFNLQKQNENGSWIENTDVYYADFTAESYKINHNNVTEMNISWDYICGALNNGHYRIVKEVNDFRKSGDYDRLFLYAEFDISVNSELSSTSKDTDNLIYYGKHSIQVDKRSNIIIQLAGLDDYDSIKSIIVYNCQTKHEVQLPVSGEVKYTAEDDASYYIYAIKDDGDFVDLSNRIGIEHAYTTDDEFIMD